MSQEGIQDSVPIVVKEEDAVGFICSKKMIDDLINLFKEPSEKLAIDRVKKGKKPTGLEMQASKSSIP